jgi:hypothetical protein
MRGPEFAVLTVVRSLSTQNDQGALKMYLPERVCKALGKRKLELMWIEELKGCVFLAGTCNSL